MEIQTQEIENRIRDHLDELFPKGECKERGQALVLNGWFTIELRKLAEKFNASIKRTSKTTRQGLPKLRKQRESDR